MYEKRGGGTDAHPGPGQEAGNGGNRVLSTGKLAGRRAEKGAEEGRNGRERPAGGKAGADPRKTARPNPRDGGLDRAVGRAGADQAALAACSRLLRVALGRITAVTLAWSAR